MSNPQHIEKPRAYSYLRFSTPEQMRGDSYRRQTSMARDYAARHGLELDADLTFQDLGVSAYRGANAEAGRLADFLEAVRLGQVARGSFLLVEALDRLSRLVPRKAYRVLEDIVTEGITVVTLNDGRSYTTDSLDSDPTSLLVAIVLFMRANEESQTKSKRVRAAWDGKRQSAATKPLTAQVPAWIAMDRTGTSPRLVLLADRSAVVRRVFAEFLAGRGHHAISEGLNQDGVPRFGRATHWHRTYIKKILANPATYGVYVPHQYTYEGNRRIRTPLEPIADYFPAVVSQQVFEECQALRGSGHAPKHRAGHLVNLLGGLACCSLCGSTMTRVNKGASPRSGKPRLVCTKAKAKAGCECIAVDLQPVESALLSRPDLLVAMAPNPDADLESSWHALQNNIEATQEAIRNLLDALSASPSPAVAARLREIESALDEQLAEEATLIERMSGASSAVLTKRLAQLEEALTADPLDRPKANAALRTVVSRVVVDLAEGILRVQWKHGGESEVRFAMPARHDTPAK